MRSHYQKIQRVPSDLPRNHSYSLFGPSRWMCGTLPWRPGVTAAKERFNNLTGRAIQNLVSDFPKLCEEGLHALLDSGIHGLLVAN